MADRVNRRSSVDPVLFRRLRDYQALRRPRQEAPEVKRPPCRPAPGKRTVRFSEVERPPAMIATGKLNNKKTNRILNYAMSIMLFAYEKCKQ